MFVEFPNGLFTTGGQWFHTTLAELIEFAGPVLQRVSVEKLIKDAETWIRIPDTMTLWVFLGSLLRFGLPTAVLGGVVLHFLLSVMSPGLVLRPGIALARVLENPLSVGLAYIAALSWLGSGGEVAAVIAGLAGFIGIRWGLLTRAMAPVVAPIQRRLFRLGVSDQVLRGVITRNALALRVDVGDLAAMESHMMAIANRHRK